MGEAASICCGYSDKPIFAPFLFLERGLVVDVIIVEVRLLGNVIGHSLVMTRGGWWWFGEEGGEGRGGGEETAEKK